MITLSEYDITKALTAAVTNSHLNIIKSLVSGTNMDASAYYSIIRIATDNGDLEIVKFLAKKVNLLAINGDEIVSHATRYGHIEVVKFLVSLPNINPFAYKNMALKTARENKYYEIVKYLTSLWQSRK